MNDALKNKNKCWLVIVNPNAGLKKARSEWQLISDMFIASGVNIYSIFTKYKGHAVELTKEYISKGYKKIIVVGGDGSMNEVANGIFLQQNVPTNEITIGVIPIGSGNDWCRTFDIPFDHKKVVEIIKRGRSCKQDIGWVTYYLSDKKQKRYFVNNTGMGFDALVAKKVNKAKSRGKGSALLYLKHLFISLISYKFIETQITVDGQIIKANVFSQCIGVCQYNGGGMKQLPNAVPDDGLLDGTTIKKLSKLKVIRNIKNLYDGSFIKLPQVITFQGKSIKVESDKPMYIEVDGESLGHTPFEFGIIPNSLNVIVGDGYIC